MNRSSNSHSSLFLMEMMIAIMLFSLASAVCLRMFATCHQISEDTKDLNMAVYQAGNAAELLRDAMKSAEGEGLGFPGCILAEYPQAMADGAKLSIYYDADWKLCQEGDSTHCMEIVQGEEGGLALYDIHVRNMDGGEGDVYSLPLKLHQPQRP
ncbi:MAG: hypothetical protein HFH38_13380 [Lachnospiraceae bacterium]|jgi:hypothetical protein|nr:hypothetical protein [Lachnospiraceae bacterium]